TFPSCRQFEPATHWSRPAARSVRWSNAAIHEAYIKLLLGGLRSLPSSFGSWTNSAGSALAWRRRRAQRNLLPVRSVGLTEGQNPGAGLGGGSGVCCHL